MFLRGKCYRLAFISRFQTGKILKRLTLAFLLLNLLIFSRISISAVTIKPDPTFDGGGIATATVGTNIAASAFDRQPDGKIVATGSSQQDGFGVIRFTQSGARPFDFEGDGKTDAAVFRPSNSTWYLQRSTNGFTAIGFGTTGDLPLPNVYVR